MADIAKIDPRSPSLFLFCASLFIFCLLLKHHSFQNGEPNYGLRGWGSTSKRAVRAIGSVGLARVVFEDVLLEEPALVSVPVFAFGLSAGSAALVGSAIAGVATGVALVVLSFTD